MLKDIRKEQMTKFLHNFKGNPDREKKYMELLLLGGEASPFSYLERKSLRRMAVVLTTKCNLSCIWCHRNVERFKDYLNYEMPIDMFKSIVPELKGFLWLHIGGLGEPMLYPHIYEAIKESRQHIPDVKLTTNGTMLNKENCKRLIKSGLSYIEVSIDGFDGITNKKVRGVHEDKLIDNLKYLSWHSNIPIQINSALADVNYDSLFEMVDKLKEVKNIVLIHTIPLVMTDHLMKLGVKEITTEQHRELILHWQKRRKELNLKFKMWPNLQETEIELVITMKRKHNICFQVYEDPIINVFGFLSPCGRSQEICLDSIAELGFEGAWNGPKMLEWRTKQLRGDYSTICQTACHMKIYVP